ncbi:S8 family serine peptidase [Stieleria sp. ICT_E10.1]|uniref:S8 family serine peptidase n=1 Tax=Stieleria sedimenti TaxID=2976331 RepID=UPI00217F80B4|nr:S8 family serine peptidase [Stieleria sedimenti]MCS7465782.1 S8 family serine peptidase [Stieleria sedimenti]
MPRCLQHKRSRRKLFEQLEPRCLLAADGGDNWHPDDLGGTGFGGPFVTTGPPLVSSAPSFSDAAEVMSNASFDPENASTANLFPTAAHPVDGNNNVIVPQAGEPFFVRVEFTYDNPLSDAYSVGRTVNNNPQHVAPPITWGSGLGGRTTWHHVWGAWVMHKAGTYSITVTLDVDGTVDESNEADNSITVNFSVGGDITHEWSLVDAEQGRNLLGDGTDVIVGTMDDAFDFNHPWFTGVDSLGRERLVASSQNTDGPGDSPVNANHATAVMGIVMARGENDGDVTGLAPDARFVTAEFINRAQIPGLSVQDVFDAAGFLVEHGAEVINMSWSWWAGSATDSYLGETSKTNLLVDYLSYGLDIVAVPAVNQLGSHPRPTAPGSSRNVITVGGLRETLDRAWSQQDYGPTLDGRSKPDLIGNAAVDVVSTRADWRDGRLAGGGFGGTSFATPFVTGAVAQMLDYGKRNQLTTDHRLIKAIVMNSGTKTLDADGSPWSNTVTQPLDNQQGTGVLNLSRVHDMYSSGQQLPGKVAPIGYDFGEINGTVNSGGGVATYDLGHATSAGEIDVTLTWDRHTFWNDVNSNGRIDAADNFYVDPNDAQDNLDLVLLRDSVPVARSESTVDNVEHLHVTNLQPGRYELQVLRRDVANSGPGETYALAWHSDAVYAQPPKVDLIQVGQSASRSLVTEVTVNFDQLVEHAELASAFVLTNTSTQTQVGQVNVLAADNGNKTSAKLTFAGASTSPRQGPGASTTSLVDGQYELRIVASHVIGQGGIGQGGISMSEDYFYTGSEATDDFFRLFGDTDGDRDVDGQDYGRFGLTFLQNSLNPNFNSQLDYDGDGDVDGQDYGNFGMRFLKSLD